MIQSHIEADLIVIGSGATGLSAALTAVEGGAKVIVFEKQPALGGTSNFCEGTFAVESDMQKKQYITYSRDEAFKNFMEYSHWKANARLVRAFVNESANTIRWLLDQGVEFSEVTINMPNVPRTYHVVKGKGEALIRALVVRSKEKGVEIYASNSVKKILKQDGRIFGVIVEKDDAEISVRSKAVMIATGGYVNNREWIKKYMGFDLDVDLFPVGSVGKMGDGIRMAFEVGAAKENISGLEINRFTNFNPKNPLDFVVNQPDLWVDPRGRRFCDESITFYDSSKGNVSGRYREGYNFSVFDDSIIKRVHEKGIVKNVGIENPPGSKPVGFYEFLQVMLQSKPEEIVEGDSIEELATKMKVMPDTLRSTIEEYNLFCAKGHDDLFAKDLQYLHPLAGPKYYAVKAHTVCLGTNGGIKINEKMEAIDNKDNAIPGLYAGGLDAGGLYGDSYPIQAGSGTASAFATNSGRIAARNILKYLGK